MTDEQLGILLFLTSFFSGCIGLVGGCVWSWVEEIKSIGGVKMTNTCKECKCKDCPLRSDKVYGCSGLKSK